MSGTLNKVMLIGHLGDKVTVHYFEGGSSVGRFSIATNESYINKTTGQKTVTTQWHNLVVKNKLAEICETYLSKGDKIYCEGKLKTREHHSDGKAKSTIEIHVSEITFLSTKTEKSNKPEGNL